MGHLLARAAFIAGLVMIGFLGIWLLNRMFKGRLAINLFSAVNAALLVALGFNLYLWGSDDTSSSDLAPLNVAVITGVLVFRLWRNRSNETI